MTHTIILLPQAERDVEQILAWLHERSPQGAATWYRRWLEIITFLERSASGCGLAPEDDDHDETIQQVIFRTRKGRPYRAILTIRNSRVYILHVRGPGQNFVEHGEMQFPSED